MLEHEEEGAEEIKYYKLTTPIPLHCLRWQMKWKI